MSLSCKQHLSFCRRFHPLLLTMYVFSFLTLCEQNRYILHQTTRCIYNTLFLPIVRVAMPISLRANDSTTPIFVRVVTAATSKYNSPEMKNEPTRYMIFVS